MKVINLARPSKYWNIAQLEKAKSWGATEIIDIELPAVPSTTAGRETKEIVEEFFDYELKKRLGGDVVFLVGDCDIVTAYWLIELGIRNNIKVFNPIFFNQTWNWRGVENH